MARFKLARVDYDRYLLTCYRYIELNPVLAGMMVHPRDYRWSSLHCNAQGIDEARITPHPCYLDLGLCPTERQQIYRSLFQYALPSEDTEALQAHTNSAPLAATAFAHRSGL